MKTIVHKLQTIYITVYTVGRIKEQIFQTKTWYFCFLFFVLFELTEPNWNHLVGESMYEYVAIDS